MSSTRRDETCSWPAGAPRGSPVGSVAVTFWRGCPRRHSSTLPFAISRHGRRASSPTPRPPDTAAAAAPESVDLAGFGAVIFTSGFRPDYRSWIHADDAFDALGFPITQDGQSTVVRGLYFCGVHFLRKRKSSIFLGIGEDAAIVARSIAGAPAVTTA